MHVHGTLGEYAYAELEHKALMQTSLNIISQKGKKTPLSNAQVPLLLSELIKTNLQKQSGG